MKRWIAVPIAMGLCLSATGCREERLDETIRADGAEIAEERRRVREEIIEDHRDLMERIRSLPPEERRRLHEEMHRDMMREMDDGQQPSGGPRRTGGQHPEDAHHPGAPGHGAPHQPPGQGHPPGAGQGAGQTPGATPDTAR